MLQILLPSSLFLPYLAIAITARRDTIPHGVRYLVSFRSKFIFQSRSLPEGVIYFSQTFFVLFIWQLLHQTISSHLACFVGVSNHNSDKNSFIRIGRHRACVGRAGRRPSGSNFLAQTSRTVNQIYHKKRLLTNELPVPRARLEIGMDDASAEAGARCKFAYERCIVLASWGGARGGSIK